MRSSVQSVPQLQIVTFRLGPEEFGLDVFTVHEILRYQVVTPVPKSPAFVEGVIDVRGMLVPIVDLRKRFEVASADTTAETRIIIVQFGDERLGLVVDAVTEVLRIPESSIAPPPQYFRGLASEYIRGIARLEGRLIILMAIDHVLSSEERIALEEAELEVAEEESPTAEQG